MTRSSRRVFLARTAEIAAAAGFAGSLGACGGSSAGSPAPAGTETPAGTATATAVRGTAAGYPAPGAIGGHDLVDADTLWGWIERMTAVGPRLPGSEAHRRYVDDLETQLREYGLTVTRYPASLAGWNARSWSLRVVDAGGTTHTVPVAYYRPYSGETPSSGVTAAVVDVGAGGEANYLGTDVAGAIVLTDGPVARLPASVLGDMAFYVHPPDARSQFAAEDYSRVWLGVPAQPRLDTARQAGAVAVIEILGLTPALAAGQYTPHQQEYAGLPALHVDLEQGALLRSLLALGPLTATLTLEASAAETSVDYLVAHLPGAGTTAGSVLVATHTDGQNAIEENGGPALLALAEFFSRFPARDRPRDVLFMFSPNHMASEAATVKPDVWLRQHPEVSSAVAMALVAEHLGAMCWDDQGATAAYQATGRSEIVAVPVGNSDTLKQLAIDEVKASDLTRAAVLGPFQDGLFGEGTFAYRLGIPTIAFISGPTYLLQVAPGDNLDKLDRTLTHRHTLFLARLLSRMISLPSATP